MRARERQRHRQREKKQAACREPDVGLDPGTPGSHPGLKAGAKPLRPPGIPEFVLFNLRFYEFRDRGSWASGGQGEAREPLSDDAQGSRSP